MHMENFLNDSWWVSLVRNLAALGVIACGAVVWWMEILQGRISNRERQSSDDRRVAEVQAAEDRRVSEKKESDQKLATANRVAEEASQRAIKLERLESERKARENPREITPEQSRRVVKEQSAWEGRYRIHCN